MGFFKGGVESGQVGGQPTGDFAKAFTEFLQQLLLGQPSQGTPDQTRNIPGRGTATIKGTPAASPIDKTTGIAGNLMELIGGTDITGQKESLQQLIQADTTRNVADLRERFTGTGSSAGTPAAVAESLYRSEATPRTALAIGQLDMANRAQQLQALLPLLQLAGAFTGMGTSQASNYAFQTPSGAQQVADLLQGTGGLISGIKGGG